MRVWRIEHDCKEGHGPAALTTCPSIGPSDHAKFRTVYYSRPDYGFRHEPPQTDEMLKTMFEYEYCGTLPKQFPEWWGPIGEPVELPVGWLAVEYEVPEEFVRVGEHQVLFHREVATRVRATRTDFPREADVCLLAWA